MTTRRSGFVAQSFDLSGRVALITGGRGDLAEAMAAGLADLGCDIALASRNAEECSATASRIASDFGVRGAGLACDITDEQSIIALVDAVIDQFGRIDILINNAGASWWGLPEEIPLKGWQKVMDVNLTGTFLASRTVARHMIDLGGGAIINIASVGGFISSRPEDGQVVPYTTSKAAIVHLTSDLAAQWADKGIRVNAIAPGSIETGMTETLTPEVQERTRNAIRLRRFGQPDEVVGTLALLASDAGSFITGQTFLVDGGQSLA